MRIHKYVFSLCIVIVLISGKQACKDNMIVEKVTDVFGLSEGPHWDHRTQKLYFVDIYNQYIHRLDPATGVVNSAHIRNGTVAVVIPVDDSTDKLVAGVGKDIVLVTWTGDTNESEVPIQLLCSLDSAQSDTRINDGKVDSSGRFWLGTMANEIDGQIASNQGTLYCVDNKLTPKKKISPVSISNGLAWNIEDNIFYYIDSPTRVVVAYNYDPNTGNINNKKIVFDLNKTDIQGIPDGMTVDANGNLWIAVFGGHHVIEVDPKKGKVLRKVKIPAENITSVTFGGPNLDILYVTTSGYNLTAEQRKATPDAGAVFAVKNLETHGLLANSFKVTN